MTGIHKSLSQNLWAHIKESRNDPNAFCGSHDFTKEKQEWIKWAKESANECKRLFQELGNKEEVLRVFREDMNREHLEVTNPTPSVRFDAMTEYLYDYISEIVDGGLRCDSKKRENDGIDYNMLFALGLPAIVCTSDGKKKGKFGGRVRKLNSYQKEWVISLKEFIERWGRGILKEPEWPQEVLVALPSKDL